MGGVTEAIIKPVQDTSSGVVVEKIKMCKSENKAYNCNYNL